MLELARDGAQWRLGIAGDSFNTALYLGRLGAQVRYFTALGCDPFSDEMLDGWRAEGMDLSLVLRDAERLPGLYAIRTDATGERSFYYWRQQAAVRQLFRLEGIAAALEAAADCDLLYLTGITLSLFEAGDRQRWIDLAVRVRAAGGRVAFDPNYRPRGWKDLAEAREALARMAPHIDILLTTDQDEAALWGFGDAVASARHWRAQGVREVVVKQGGAGATVVVDETPLQVPVGQAVTVRDSTGAGDAFNAAYLAARLRGIAPAEAARGGHRLAGRVVQVPGAILPASQMGDM